MMSPPAARLALVHLSCVVWMLYSCADGITNLKTCDTAHGWTLHGSHCYKKMEATNGWQGARYNCTLEDADLVSFADETVEDFVKRQMGDKPFWIGLSNLDCDEDWCEFSGEKELTWTNTSLTLDYTNWDTRQKGSADVESCAYVNQGVRHQPGKWRHGSCQSSLAYMCERSLDACSNGRTCSRKESASISYQLETSFCDSGDFLYKDSCYHFEGPPSNWQAAEDFCKKKGGHLASVHSPVDGEFLAAHARESYNMVGLKGTNGNLEWTDRSTTNDVPWWTGYDRGDGCAQLVRYGTVTMYPCHEVFPPICQKGKARDSFEFRVAPTSESAPIIPEATCTAKVGWTLHGSHCYKKMAPTNGWQGARYDCLWEGGDLVSITSEDEEDFVKKQMGDEPFWIGLSNLDCDEDWCEFSGEKELTWSNTSMTPDYTNWDPRQDGSSSVASCAYVNQGADLYNHPGKWRHGSCRSSLAYMCKWSPDDCPDGWPCSYKDLGYRYRRAETSFCDSGEFLYEDSCYRFEGTRKTWEEAEAFCKKKGGHLASVHSPVVGQFLFAHVRRDGHGWLAWLGLKKNNGNFEWSDTSSLDDVPWYNSYRSSDCSKLAFDGKAHLTQCDTLRPSICQKGKARDILPLLPVPTSASGKSAKCGWWQENPANDFCYLINSKPTKTWKEARDKCARLSGNLLGFADSQEHAFIQGLPPNASLWLDTNDTTVEDGSERSARSSPNSVQLAAAGDPSGPRCNSLLGGEGGPEVGDCEEKRGYVCKRRVIQTCETNNGWRRFASNCYKKMETTNGWLGARYDCVSEGGDLVSIVSPYEEIFAKMQMGDKPFWIGRSNLNCNETWCQFFQAGEMKLTQSDTAVMPTYANWYSGQDTRSDVASCAYVNQGVHPNSQPGKWRHGPCGSSLAYMCKRSPDACPEGRLCSYKDYGLGVSRVETSYCDPGDFLYKGSCYHFGGMESTWKEAEKFCQDWKGQLTSVHSLVDGQFLAAHAPHVGGLQSWVGLKKNKRNFEWSDATPAGNIEWVPNRLAGRGDCAALSQTGQLEDWPCTESQPFICKKAKVRDFLLPPPPGWSAKCGWWLERSSSDFCYLIQRRPTKAWKEARDDCLRRGSDLLSITDLHEHAFIQGIYTSLPSAPSLWLGVNNNVTKDASGWTDRSPFGYIVMDGGDPSDPSGASCLSLLTSNGRWKFDDCRKKRGYICKKRGNVPKPSQQPHNGFKEILVCNKHSADLVCEAEGQKQSRISIQSAFYGRRSDDVCQEDSYDNYSFNDDDSLEDETTCSVEGIVPRYRKLCNSQQRCHIELLEDASCPAPSKYLHMVYSCEQKVCLDSLGIADGSVADSSFKASSSMEDATPEKARLNGESCWKPSKNPLGSWILVNLGYKRKVTAIVTQGCNSTDTRSWDIPLEMRLSVDRKKWTKHPDGKFVGGGTHLLETPAFAQYVRILPLENRPEFGLRFDILGCPHEDAMTCARTFNSLHLTDWLTFYCPPGCGKYIVAGTLVYSADSHICAAAIHAGVVQNDIGGDCIVMSAPRQHVYLGSTRNRITSRYLNNPLGVSYTFADGEPRCSAPDWEEFAGFCYKHFDDKMKWADAHLVCRDFGAELVSIRTEVEQAWVKSASHLETSDMWTGLNDLALPGTLVWSDRRAVTFTHWAAGEPIQRVGLDQHCVAVLRQTGRWKRMSCARVNSFMCKMPTAHFPIAAPEPQVAP